MCRRCFNNSARHKLIGTFPVKLQITEDTIYDTRMLTGIYSFNAVRDTQRSVVHAPATTKEKEQ